MPHGAGHAGGGGGGYHGGGWGGGFHHHHYHRHGGCGVHGGLTWLIIGFIAAVIVSLSLSLTLGPKNGPKDVSSSEYYALTDNRIVSYNSDFCQGLRATSTYEPNNLLSSASLYLLNDRPPLTDRESFSLSESAQLDSYINYQYWNFYLNAGSNSSLTACYRQNTSTHHVILYIIKGSKNLDDWIDDPGKSHTVKNYPLTEQCQSISYQVGVDDVYYFVFYLGSSRFSLSTVVDIDFQFDRTLYHIILDSVVYNCSFPLDGSSSCSFGVPMSSGYVAVLSLSTMSLPVDYNDGAKIHLSCQPRAWLYAVIVCVVVIPIILIIVSVVAYIYFKEKGRKRNNYSQLIGGIQPAASNTESDTFQESKKAARESTLVKTVNPAYSPAGEYGATPTAPPPAYT